MGLIEHRIPTDPGVEIAVFEAPYKPRVDLGPRPEQTLILLHGFPQTHHCWRPALPALSEHFRCLALDLRGYGASSIPAEDSAHEVYSKRAMARDVRAVIEHFAPEHTILAGHDRGARVAYRFALDHPDILKGLMILDIVPTLDFWSSWDAKLAMAAYHWTFLAQPSPLPEQMIAGDPVAYLDHTLSSWSAPGDLSPFPPESLEVYRRQMSDPARVAAMCADYRSGWHVDRLIDAQDKAAGQKIEVPTTFLWGAHGFPAKTGDPLGAWRDWASRLSGRELASGHFAPEEATEAVAQALIGRFAFR